MNDCELARIPAALAAIQAATSALGFDMASEPQTGALLATLAAAKPGGRLLELGTGTGLGTAWLLHGMDATAHLDTVESDAGVAAVARRHLAGDARVTFHAGDAAAFLETAHEPRYDLIFADTWAGKYTHLEACLALLRPGGLYVIDDMLPQRNWPDGHALRADALLAVLEGRTDIRLAKLGWASGLVVAARL